MGHARQQADGRVQAGGARTGRWHRRGVRTCSGLAADPKEQPLPEVNVGHAGALTAPDPYRPAP